MSISRETVALPGTIAEKRITRKSLAVALTIVAMVTLFALCCLASSPLFPSFSMDSAVFQIMGECWFKGKIPYIDLFDHKGPVIYLINGVAKNISREWGLFLLEWLNLVFVGWLLYKVGELLSERMVDRIGALIFTGIFLVYYIDGGNYTETWSLCFILIPIYMLFDNVSREKNSEASFSARLMFVTGLCFGVITLQRINNGVALLAIGIIMVIMLGMRNQWYQLLVNVIAVISGFLLVVSPMVAYFAWHGALSEMWFGIIGFNLEYTRERITDFEVMKHAVMRMAPICILIFAMLLPRVNLKAPIRIFVSVCSAMSLLIFIPIGCAWHYFIMLTPMVYIMFILLFKTRTKWYIKSVTVIMALCCFISRTGIKLLLASIYSIFFVPDDNPIKMTQSFEELDIQAYCGEVKDAMELHNLIERKVPVSYYDSIYSFNLWQGIMVYNSLCAKPLGRHFYSQNWHAKISPEVATYIEEERKKLKAPYVLAANRFTDRTPGFKKTIDKEYEAVIVTSFHSLYKRKDLIH